MSDENTLEDLRSKIIQSMTGKVPVQKTEQRADQEQRPQSDRRQNEGQRPRDGQRQNVQPQRNERRYNQDTKTYPHRPYKQDGNRPYQHERGDRQVQPEHSNRQYQPENSRYNKTAQYNNNLSREAYYQKNSRQYSNAQAPRFENGSNNYSNANRNQNNRYQVQKPQQNQKRSFDINYRDPAFLLITKSKSASHIIVRMVDAQSHKVAFAARDKIKQVIENLFQNAQGDISQQPILYDPDYTEESKVATFNIITSEIEHATKILALQQFITAKSGVTEILTWSRPQNYVKNNSLIQKYSNQDLVVLRNTNITGKSREEIIQNIKSIRLDQCDLFEPLFYKESAESEQLFTNTIIILLKRSFNNTPINWKSDGPNSEIIKVNDGKYMFQNLEYLHFQNFTSLASRQVRHPSNILLLLNCIDPMDLKEKLHINELKESLKSLLKVEAQSIQIVTPSIDYRISVDHVKELAGNVFITFNTVEDATATMQQLAGYDFYGRTILCAYASHADINLPGLTFE
ncbi:hypothetical protein RNJ44_04285 [Nakaseomyces bracarensis]|uniref:RNA recognition motif domain-containing protein n=1 Tax=Nakaseomyces bracarensis TaxID=273131 RepID=A0ABR4NUG4_9SACH